MSVILPKLLNALFDTLSIAVAGFAAYFLRSSDFFVSDDKLKNPPQYLLLLGCAILVWHLIVYARGGYRSSHNIFRIDELLIHFQNSLILLTLLMAGTFLYKAYDYSRLILFFSWLFHVHLGCVARQLAARIRTFFYRRGLWRRRVVFWGEGRKRELFYKRISQNPAFGYDLASVPDGVELEAVIASEKTDEIYLFVDQISYEQVWKVRDASVNPNAIVHVVPSFGNLYLKNISGGFFDGVVMITLDSPVSRRVTMVFKRIFDFVVSLVFFCLLLPVFILCAVLVKLDSRGSVFFSQARVGRDGVPFTMYKFRTMYPDAEIYAPTPTDRRDSRITRVGSVLRSTGLDELPQLLNVLRGDMSLVGPRPEMPFIVERYSPLESKRLKVTPGITGLWQVYARDAHLPIHDHIEYDLYYIENFSVMLDLMILLDTIPTLVLRTGI